MKRADLIRKLEEAGCQFIRHGGNHDWYQNPNTHVARLYQDIGRSTGTLAKHILKKLRG